MSSLPQPPNPPNLGLESLPGRTRAHGTLLGVVIHEGAIAPVPLRVGAGGLGGGGGHQSVEMREGGREGGKGS